MEYDSIEREIHVDASPEVVFEVVSRPEHISQWWADDADICGRRRRPVVGNRRPDPSADARPAPGRRRWHPPPG
jgi:uncharacterized protein YndB with AHSA1/START domain